MGNGIYYGIEDAETFTCDGTILKDEKGLEGKVVTEIGDTEYHSSLPVWSKKSRIYFKRSDEGDHHIEQMRVFNNSRRVLVDFDWGHKHKELPVGVVHVHVWYKNKNGNWTRNKNPRLMNNEEIQQYGDILRIAFPAVKFHP